MNLELLGVFGQRSEVLALVAFEAANLVLAVQGHLQAT